MTSFLPLESITRGDNDRRTFPESEIRELAENIAAHGLAQPITVRPVSTLSGATHEIVAGECRYRAHVLLAAEDRSPLGGQAGQIECHVRDMSDREASAIMLCENLARHDIRPLDEAEGYASRIALYGLSPAEVAAWAGVGAYRVTERLKLLRLTPEARKLAEDHAPDVERWRSICGERRWYRRY